MFTNPLANTYAAPKPTKQAAPAEAPGPRQGVALATSMIPGCCGLKTVRQLHCLGKTDELSKGHAEGFDKKVNVGTADDGNWATYGRAPETIAIITNSTSYCTQAEFERQQKFFEKKGWSLLASWPSDEAVRRGQKDGMNYMYGSPGIKNL